MWNVDLYKRMLVNAAREGNFNGRAVKNKEAIYRYLSAQLYVSYDTVKSWTRARSTGPGDKIVLSELEAMFNVKLTTKDKEEGITVMCKEKYSDFVKQNIKQCYELVMDFVQEGEIEDEESYCKMRRQFDKMKVWVPREVYDKILDFIDTYLDSIIYGDDNIFSDMYTEELGYYDEEHCFHLRNEEATFKFTGMFFEKLIQLEKKLEELGMKELYPIFIG